MGILRTHPYSFAKIAVFFALFASIICFAFVSDVFAAESKRNNRPGTEEPSIATPTKIFTGRAPLPAPTGAFIP